MDPKLFDKFVIETGKRITALRSEAAKYRNQRNAARADLDKAMQRIRKLHAELEEARRK